MSEEPKFTSAVQDALAEAQKIAAARHHQAIEIPHLFKFLIQPGELASDIYKKAGIDIVSFEKKIDDELDRIAISRRNECIWSKSFAEYVQIDARMRRCFEPNFRMSTLQSTRCSLL